jgi:hypothetical protein
MLCALHKLFQKIIDKKIPLKSLCGARITLMIKLDKDDIRAIDKYPS